MRTFLCVSAVATSKIYINSFISKISLTFWVCFCVSSSWPVLSVLSVSSHSTFYSSYRWNLIRLQRAIVLSRVLLFVSAERKENKNKWSSTLSKTNNYYNNSSYSAPNSKVKLIHFPGGERLAQSLIEGEKNATKKNRCKNTLQISKKNKTSANSISQLLPQNLARLDD